MENEISSAWSRKSDIGGLHELTDAALPCANDKMDHLSEVATIGWQLTRLGVIGLGKDTTCRVALNDIL
jgi:hypothetical protein